MGFRLARPETAFSQQPVGKHSKPTKDKDYLAFLHELPCIVTGRTPVEAAHISYADPRAGKLGRGKGRKESDCWAVPLCQEEHALQHTMDEQAYWRSVGIDPVPVAAFLYAACPSVERAMLVIRSIRRPAALKETSHAER